MMRARQQQVGGWGCGAVLTDIRVAGLVVILGRQDTARDHPLGGVPVAAVDASHPHTSPPPDSHVCRPVHDTLSLLPPLPQVPRPEGRKFVKRQIRHPHFLNESVQEVAAQVAALPPGECRMRPSVKGPQMLGLTLKLHESPGQAPDDPPLHIIKHYDIKEVRGCGGLLASCVCGAVHVHECGA